MRFVGLEQDGKIFYLQFYRKSFSLQLVPTYVLGAFLLHRSWRCSRRCNIFGTGGLVRNFQLEIKEFFLLLSHKAPLEWEMFRLYSMMGNFILQQDGNFHICSRMVVFISAAGWLFSYCSRMAIFILQQDGSFHIAAGW